MKCVCTYITCIKLNILTGTVAENCTWECIRNNNNLRLFLVILTQVRYLKCTRSNLRESKIQKFPGGPPDPLDAMCLCTSTFTLFPPLTLINFILPPSSHFLDEGLHTYKISPTTLPRKV